MKRLFILSFAALTACATAPQSSHQVAGLPSQPKLTVRMTGYTLQEMSESRASCPSKFSATADEQQQLKWAAGCVRADQWKRVEDLGNQLCLRDPMSPWGAYFLSLSAEHAKDLPRARWMAELAVKNAPDEGVALYQLGRVQWEMDEKPAAYKTLARAADKSPALVEAHVLLGNLALLDERTSEANREFSKAFQNDAKHFGALMGLAEVGFRTKAWVDVEKYLRLAIHAHPTSLMARLRLGEGQELAKNNSGALQTYQEILKLEKSHRLDAQLTVDLVAKVKTLQASVAEELKRKLADRQPSNERKTPK